MTDTTASAAPREAIALFQKDLDAVRGELGRVIVGHDAIVDGVLTCLLAGGHCLLEGVPGLGKTLLVRTLGRVLDLTFSRIQFTPDLIPVDILGAQVLADDGRGGRAITFQRGPIFANIVLADEINRATPKTQSALLEAMQEQSVTVARTTHTIDAPFFVLATQNPLEMEGTYPLPEAQLDRFLYKLQVEFPTREAMHTILDRTTGVDVAEAKPALSRERILALRGLVRQVPVARSVQDLAIRAVMATHPDDAAATPKVKRFVRFGASPRGAQALLLGAKIRAVMAGRFAASSDDVRACALPALRHRMILNFEGEAEGVRPDDVLGEVLASLKAQD